MTYVHSTPNWHATSTPPPSWRESKAAADAYFEQAAAILSRLGFRNATPAPESADWKGVDVITDLGPVAWRNRDAHYLRFRDITIRVSRPSGVETEADKIRRGAVRWLLWTWTRGGKVVAWALLGADRVATLLALPWPTKQMRDAAFACIPIAALWDTGAVVVCEGLET